MDLIYQPNSPLRLGEYLLAHLADGQWTEFRAAVAFAKRSGTQHLRDPLSEFDARAATRLSVGIDLLGTSTEALQDLLGSITNGSLWVFHNAVPSTFHPKIYVFKNENRADVVVGSGNLTEGGLFTNYEASLAVTLQLTQPPDATFMAAIDGILDAWSHDIPGMCYRVTLELLDRLGTSGLLRSEAQITAATRQAAATAPTGAPARTGQQADEGGGPATGAAPMFRGVAVQPAPAPPNARGPVAPGPDEEVATTLAEAAATGPTEPGTAQMAPIPVTAPGGLPVIQLGGVRSFVMTLQNTDVGFGQTTPGTARRSPEVFIPLIALDSNPAFWKFPHRFVPDAGWDAAHPHERRNGLGKLDRHDVTMRIGVIRHVNMFFNPQKRDLRLRNEALRRAGAVGDILCITAVDPSIGFEYDVQIAPQGSALFQQLQAYCNTPVGHGSSKLYGYY